MLPIGAAIKLISQGMNLQSTCSQPRWHSLVWICFPVIEALHLYAWAVCSGANAAILIQVWTNGLQELSPTFFKVSKS
jgi:hypothetical protein